MKKLFLFAALTTFIFISCNDETKVGSEANTKAQKNLEASHIVNKAFETGDVSMIDSVVASDFVDHTDRGDMGRDSLKAFITRMHQVNTDMKMEVVKELADDDYVFALQHYSGTSKGDIGMPAGPYDMKAIEVVRFKDGKAVEHWSYMEMREMMKMMGQMNPADTARKN